MRISDFQKKTEDELLQLAEDCFIAMDTAGVEQEPAYLLQAQLYMDQAAKLSDSRVADRDFKMAKRSFKLEVWVIVLIGIEILLSIVGLWYGIREGNKQIAVLSQLNTSATATAKASEVQADALPKLVEEQKNSLSSLSDMNANLQGSLKKTTDMSVAMQKQLKILQDEQAARLAELAKKPKLELYVENVPLDSFSGVNFKAREASETKLTFDTFLINSGDATAHKGMVRVIVDVKDVAISASAPSTPIPELEKDDPQHGVLIPFDYIRPGVRIPWTITLTYPAGQQPFSIYFNIDADEIPTATRLGSFTARPPRP
jgi:hypothetical protein